MSDTVPNIPNMETVKRLALVWEGLHPTVQGYFEELYADVPDKVSKVLAGAELLPDAGHPTLGSWAGSGSNDQGYVSAAGMLITLGNFGVDPENPGTNESFNVAWSIQTERDFPARKDTIQILDSEGKSVVAEKTIDIDELKGTSADYDTSFDGLPNGAYTLSVLLNVEGATGGAYNEHGAQTGPMITIFHVGETREAQIAHDLPIYGTAMDRINAAASRNAEHEIAPATEDESGTTTPAQMGLKGYVYSDLAEACEGLMTLDVLADGFKSALRNASAWLREEATKDYVLPEEEWATVRGKLLSVCMGSANDIEKAGDATFELISILEDVADRSFS